MSYSPTHPSPGRSCPSAFNSKKIPQKALEDEFGSIGVTVLHFGTSRPLAGSCASAGDGCLGLSAERTELATCRWPHVLRCTMETLGIVFPCKEAADALCTAHFGTPGPISSMRFIPLSGKLHDAVLESRAHSFAYGWGLSGDDNINTPVRTLRLTPPCPGENAVVFPSSRSLTTSTIVPSHHINPASENYYINGPASAGRYLAAARGFSIGAAVTVLRLPGVIRSPTGRMRMRITVPPSRKPAQRCPERRLAAAVPHNVPTFHLQVGWSTRHGAGCGPSTWIAAVADAIRCFHCVPGPDDVC